MKVNQNPSPTTGTIDKAQSAGKREPIAKGSPNIPGSTVGRGGASVDISDTARFMKQASDIAHSVPDIRADKVQDLKKRIAEGNYKVDSAKIADKLVEEHLISDFGKNAV